ncbi:DNA-binding CsgD family transcriptional regulator [Bradyrhizobium sp. BR13661]|jgi:DNA-binding CsgD family transcriptional regulator|nr:DNA-binding CsgD family transcriptional regulator [Bradyrhizobium sp. BR13661]
MAATRLGAVSDYLLNLYERSAETGPAPYASLALDGLRDLTGAKKAWWGILAPSESGPRLLSSVRSDLPPAWEATWESVKNDDKLAHSLMRNPNHTFRLDSSTIPRGSGLIRLADGFDIRETIVSSVRIPEQNAFMFVSLYRGSTQRSFTSEDRAISQLLISHLYVAWRQNLGERLRSPRTIKSTHRAFANRDGQLVRWDEGFLRFVDRHWPSWRGSTLPPLLRETIRRSDDLTGCWIGQGKWSVRVEPAGLLKFIELRESSALDCLTQRELQVAEMFADGATHKEIALATGLTPSTVRYYIREAYSKLNIDNKALLASLVSGSRTTYS